MSSCRTNTRGSSGSFWRAIGEFLHAIAAYSYALQEPTDLQQDEEEVEDDLSDSDDVSASTTSLLCGRGASDSFCVRRNCEPTAHDLFRHHTVRECIIWALFAAKTCEDARKAAPPTRQETLTIRSLGLNLPSGWSMVGEGNYLTGVHSSGKLHWSKPYAFLEHHRLDTAVIAFYGSSLKGDWITNAKVLSKNMFHMGFYDASSTAFEEVWKFCKSTERKNIIISGHSLGGAVACVLGYRVRSRAQELGGKNVTIITLGQPKAVDFTLFGDFEKVVPKRTYLRVVRTAKCVFMKDFITGFIPCKLDMTLRYHPKSFVIRLDRRKEDLPKDGIHPWFLHKIEGNYDQILLLNYE